MLKQKKMMYPFDVLSSEIEEIKKIIDNVDVEQLLKIDFAKQITELKQKIQIEKYTLDNTQKITIDIETAELIHMINMLYLKVYKEKNNQDIMVAFDRFNRIHNSNYDCFTQKAVKWNLSMQNLLNQKMTAIPLFSFNANNNQNRDGALNLTLFQFSNNKSLDISNNIKELALLLTSAEKTQDISLVQTVLNAVTNKLLSYFDLDNLNVYQSAIKAMCTFLKNQSLVYTDEAEIAFKCFFQKLFEKIDSEIKANNIRKAKYLMSTGFNLLKENGVILGNFNTQRLMVDFFDKYQALKNHVPAAAHALDAPKRK